MNQVFFLRRALQFASGVLPFIADLHSVLRIDADVTALDAHENPVARKANLVEQFLREPRVTYPREIVIQVKSQRHDILVLNAA